MESRFWGYINWGILVVVTLIVIWMVFDFSHEEKIEDIFIQPECVDVGALDGFDYEACYDAFSETIFLKVDRDKGKYIVNSLDISFVDLASRSFSLDDVPGAGESRAYKISANKNPRGLSVQLGVIKDFSNPVCEGENVFVDYCPIGTGGMGVDVSISPLGGVGIKDFIEVSNLRDFASDVVDINLVEKEAIWESVCKSSWDCGGWEACEDGVQRRNCKDINNCVISTDPFATVRNCDGSCIENWECEWSGCEDGFSSPSCRDLNSCGTSLSIPKKLACEDKGECFPNVVCGAWSECNVDYDFVDLVGDGGVVEIDGGQTRVCVDSNDCVSTVKEERGCSVSVDIYTERFDRCGKSYVGVYDVLDDGILAVLEEGRGKSNYLNIYFSDQNGIYCDYCFDGKMDGDEEGVDCGGSCKDCSDGTLPKRSWWEFLFG